MPPPFQSREVRDFPLYQEGIKGCVPCLDSGFRIKPLSLEKGRGGKNPMSDL